MQDREQQAVRIESIKSLNSNSEVISNKLGQEQKLITDADHLYQIDINPQASSINRDEILKIFKQLQAQEEPNLKSNKSKNQPQIAKKKSQHKPLVPQKKTQFSHLSEKAKERVDKMVKSYKTMFRPAMSDTEVRKFGYENKQKVFQYLLYGIEQLKTLPKQELSEFQNKLISFEKELFDTIKRITGEIDRALVQLLNKGSKGGSATREYRLQWGNIASNIRDQKNFQLRRKILNKTFTPQKIAQAKQIEFYTSVKRQQIFRKQKQYLAQFQKEDEKNVEMTIERDQIIDQPTIPYSISGKTQQTHKGSTKYLEEGTIELLRNLVSSEQVNKMKKRLQDDLTDYPKNRLIQSLQKTFRTNI